MSATFKVTLQDKVSRPAKKAAASVRDLGRDMRAAKGGAASASSGLSVLKAGLIAAGVAASVAAVALGRVGVALGKSAVQSAAFMEQNRLAFGLMLKGADKGAAALEGIRKVALDLGLPIKETIKNYRKLLSMQFRPDAATDIIKLGADMRALGATTEEVSSIIRAMTQIKAKGRLQQEELTQQLAEAGVSAELVYKQLGKTMGKSMEEVRKAIEAGKVDADTALDAIQKAILQKLGTDAPGQAAEQFTKGLGGMWATVMSQAENAMLELGDRIGPRIKEIFGPVAEDIKAAFSSPEAMAALDEIVNRFDIIQVAVDQVKAAASGWIEGFSETWADIKPAIDETVEAILEFAGSSESLGDIKAQFKDVGKVAAVALGAIVVALALGTAALSAFARAWEGSIEMVGDAFTETQRDFDEAIGEIGEGFDAIGEFFSDLPGKISEGVEGLGDAAAGLGSDIIDGIVGGLWDTAGELTGAIKEIVDAAIRKAKEALGIASPSKVFEGIGRNVAQGFAGGVRAEEGLVAASTAKTVTASAQAAAAAGNTINQRFNGGANTFNISGADSPEDTAAAIADIQLGQLATAFEQLGNSMGATVG